jgi:oxalate decarboxylase/phosphoglucose isomerase-like protein (cupin superfamily)
MSLDFVLDIQRWGGVEPTAVKEGYSWVWEGSYCSVLYTRAGMFRGNHIHPYDQHTLLLKGKGRYVFREDGVNVDYNLEEGKILDVPTRTAHIFLPEEDCLTVE